MRYRLFPILLAGVAGLALLDPPRSEGQAPDGDGATPGVEVQARGAVHEAYADGNRTQGVPGPIVQKDPPRLIEEAPPDEKPQGENIMWIPGYWSWEDERADFVWISGFWRAVPPGRSWIPGSWQQAGAGFRWVSGYWGITGQDETQYLPRPPESIDNGPSVPSPGENYSYVPGCWVYQSVRYVWRPGYWCGYRPGWVWTPSCYRWTPCGFVYVSGFWDVPLLDRGLLFAPVCFRSAVYLTPGFVYRPAFCIQPDFLCGALFVRRSCGCYFFGDYFGSPYRSGFTAWTSFRFGGGVGIDLNFGYYRNAYRGHPGWERGLNGLYAGRFAGTIAAPPRTLVQQNTVINNITVNRTTNNIVNKNVNITNIQNVTALSSVKNINKVNVTAMSSLAGTAKPPAAVTRDIQVAKLSPTQLAEEKKGITRFNAIARERRNTETKLVAKAPTSSTAAPLVAKLDLPKGTPPARVVKTATPPPPPEKTRIEPTDGTKPGAVVTKPGSMSGGATPPVTKPGTTTLPATKPGTTLPPATKPGTTAPPATKPTSPPPAGTTPPATKPTTPPATKPITPPVTKPITPPAVTTPPPAAKPTSPPPSNPTKPAPPPPAKKPENAKGKTR